MVQAGASAVLVAALLPGGGLPRAVDALIGGAIGLAVAAVLPADPLAGARRAMRALLDEVADALRVVAAGIRERDEAAVFAALSRARGTQPTVEELRSAVRADYALRNVRVLARRALAALREGEALAPELPDRLDDLAGAAELLRDELDRSAEPDAARRPAHRGCGLRRPAARGCGFSGRVVVAQLRSVVLDLLPGHRHAAGGRGRRAPGALTLLKPGTVGASGAGALFVHATPRTRVLGRGRWWWRCLVP